MSFDYRRSHRLEKVVNGKVNMLYVPKSPETFYDIPGWPGYRISQYKNVFSEKSHRFLKQYQTHRGKPQKHVFLRGFNGKLCAENVQKLFWKTFYVPRGSKSM